jgi:hypothetical protein
MLVITAVCSMSAVNGSRPPHRPHASTSKANVRRISSAQHAVAGGVGEVGRPRSRQSASFMRLATDADLATGRLGPVLPERCGPIADQCLQV